MDSTLNNQQGSPERLKYLASGVMYSIGNNILHQFVLDNSDPNNSVNENYINAVLLTLASTSVNVNALNDEGYSPLHLAVSKKNIVMVRKLLSCLVTIDVNKKCSYDGEENTALHLAAKLGHLSIVQELLNCHSGADVNKKNVNGTTALCFAAELGNLDLMEILVNKGANVNTKYDDDRHLYYTLEFCSSEDLKFFIRNKSDSDIIDYENENILNYSVPREPRWFLIKDDRGVIVHCEEWKNISPLNFAVQAHNIEAIKYLVNSGADLDIRDCIHNSILHYAVESNNIDIVAYLVSKNANINAKNKYRCTVLHYAAERSNVEMIKFLIKNGADLNAVDVAGDTVLHYSAQSCKIFSIEFFLNSGFHINVENRRGMTPLHHALRYWRGSRKLNVVKFLISYGADVNAKDQRNSCLHYAILNSDLEAIKLLLSNGADLDAVNHSNQTALDYARRYCGDEIINFLMSIGSRGSNEIALQS